MGGDETILRRLMAVIEDRREKRPPGSYTSGLFEGGVEAIGAKVREEAAELIEAAQSTGGDARAELVHEAADLIYHVLVMLACGHATLPEVENELARRFGTSGLQEKASRNR